MAMDSNGISQPSTSHVKPLVRPALPKNIDEIRAFRKEQAISSQLGNTPRKIRKADGIECSKLTLRSESNATSVSAKQNETPQKTLQERHVVPITNSKGQIRPPRPSLPAAIKRANESKTEHATSHQLKGIASKVRKADADEVSKLTTRFVQDDSKEEKTQQTASSFKKKVSGRAIKKSLGKAKRKIGNKLVGWQEKGSRLRDAGKTWAEAPWTNTKALMASGWQSKGEVYDKFKTATKEKAKSKLKAASELYEKAKAAKKTWSEAKLDTTVSVAYALYKSGKKKLTIKKKSIADYNIGTVDKTDKKIKLANVDEGEGRLQKNIKDRECTVL